MSEHEMKVGDMSLTNSFVYTVSREMALDMGMIEPTPEELTERNESSRRFHGEQREKRAKTLAALASLRGRESLTDAMLDLHSCDTEADWSAECAGCDFGGYESEAPEWPCRTVILLAEHHGVDMPNSLPGRHYEDDFKPSDGKVWTPPRPRWPWSAAD